MTREEVESVANAIEAETKTAGEAARMLREALTKSEAADIPPHRCKTCRWMLFLCECPKVTP